MRRWQVLGLAVLAAVALACEGTGKADPRPSGTSAKGPSTMAALGDSITVGFGSCLLLLPCEKRSWSTGTDAAVDSHYHRLREGNPKVKARNYAEPGARAADLAGQARSAVTFKAQYVTILIGANDACAPTVAGMTATATFRKRIDAGLAELKAGLPRSRVLMVSIPDLHRLWEVGHDDQNAVRAWNHGVCPSLLANPTSTAAADESRRDRVAARIEAYNDELAAACQAYGRKCKWDGGKVHRVRFGLDMVNHLDYFHPDSRGQAKLADVSYPGRFTW